MSLIIYSYWQPPHLTLTYFIYYYIIPLDRHLHLLYDSLYLVYLIYLNCSLSAVLYPAAVANGNFPTAGQIKDYLINTPACSCYHMNTDSDFLRVPSSKQTVLNHVLIYSWNNRKTKLSTSLINWALVPNSLLNCKLTNLRQDALNFAQTLSSNCQKLQAQIGRASCRERV